MGSQMIQIIILAAIALFLVLRLRSVLGTRAGYEKPTEPLPTPAPRERPSLDVIEGGGPDRDISDFIEPESDAGKALAEMKRVDRSFTVAQFTHGARQAYEMLVMAFETGDIDTLRQFLSPEVFATFEGAIKAREARGYVVEANFQGVSEVKLADARFDPATKEGEITMRFLGELTSVVRDKEGRVVEGAPNELRRQRDIWTFGRVMTSDNPNWLLTGTAG
ncbi:Tim44/TimA family putative adaptor protein [Amaricoccus solimangrovi]|uniref:Tim44 domain-containing protein n=1 Tax=Amaricoccus solimangrovi TaxID=2589815 RepID=A0A501WS30_9RHOB|nr:Tim44/TimA family putative adaptor protein [Amaricoccus solimangrovi]TPE52543.1 Tim44 domain-containing protein [Amaricoccus solimangrovi]